MTMAAVQVCVGVYWPLMWEMKAKVMLLMLRAVAAAAAAAAAAHAAVAGHP
jgi:hypothetical protein